MNLLEVINFLREEHYISVEVVASKEDALVKIQASQESSKTKALHIRSTSIDNVIEKDVLIDWLETETLTKAKEVE